MIIEVSRRLCRLIGVLVLVAMAGVLYWYMRVYDPVDDVVIMDSSAEFAEDNEQQNSDENAEEESEDSEESIEEPVMLAIHVSGAVKNPDKVYYLEDGKRVADAVEAAGGIVKEADLSQLNLARKLQDGERIYVPHEGEEIQGESTAGGIMQDIVENQEKPLTNINLASTIELMELPGIGQTYAERIVEYREANGGFQDIEEIKNVSGIGDSTFEKIKDRITVSG